MGGYQSSLVKRGIGRVREGGLPSLYQGVIETIGKHVWTQTLRRRAVHREELKEYASENGELWLDTPEPEIEFPSQPGDGVPDEFGGFDWGRTRKRPFICEVPNMHLAGPGAVGLLNGRRLVFETTGITDNKSFFATRRHRVLGSETRCILLRQYSRRDPGPPIYPDSYAFPMVSTIYPSYYHWIIDFLPKMRQLERYEKVTGREPTILVEVDASSYERETLSLLGYDESRIQTWCGDEHEIENLVIASQDYHSHSRWDYQWLRDRLRSAVQPPSSRAPSKRIYISRQHATGRRVVNNDEVITELDSRGFTSYRLESLSVAEQIALFRDAEVVVAPHGAGLVNILFASSPIIFELLPDNEKLLPYFYFLAEMLDFEYEAMVVDAKDEDLHVDIPRFRERLDRVGVE